MEFFKSFDNMTKRNPSMFFIMGFIIIVLTGATILNFPFSSVDGKSIGFIDALFTATSATCVTGLTTVTTAAQWTLIGKIIILCLIQIGGLGLMTLSTIIAFFLGKKISLKTRLLIKEERNTYELQGVVRVTRNVVIYTIIVELIGAVLFSFQFCKEYGLLKGIWYSVFHSVSSFCNAGFDIIGDTSFMKYVTNPLVNFTTIMLIIVGGLGFFVVIEIIKIRRFSRFSLHTKVVLIVSGILIISGMLSILFLEFFNIDTIGGLSFLGKLQASLFQSVTTRTAGYATINMAGLKDSTSSLMCILMFIGGSSGSTAGGVKITTIAVIVLAIHSTVYGKKSIDIYQKNIPGSVVMKSVSIVGIAFSIVVALSILLSITQRIEGASFVDYLFESVSAFGTVGLTRNLTPFLNTFGKLLICVTMFIGRVGPLTIAYAVASSQVKTNANITYPDGKIIIG